MGALLSCCEPQDPAIREVRGSSSIGHAYCHVIHYNFYSLGGQNEQKPEFSFEQRLWR